MKRPTIISLFIMLALSLSSCSMHLGLSNILGSGSNSSTPGAKTIKATHTPPSAISAISIVNGKFRPKNVTVKVGTTLTWTNNDSSAQSVTSDVPNVFDSGPLDPGATFTYTFSQTGVFPYHSTGSSVAFGTITVTP